MPKSSQKKSSHQVTSVVPTAALATPPVVTKMSPRLWLLLAGIILFALFLRLTGIWRTEPINYHADDWVLARPILDLANDGTWGEKAHYKWSACGVIYPLGYGLHALKPIAGPYTYNAVLVIQRVMSAVASSLAVLAGFLLMRKLVSVRAAFIAAALLTVAKLPVLQGHHGTVTATVSLIILLLMWLLCDLFDVDGKITFSSLKLLRCGAVGFLIGWGIASKWTILLSVIPISGAFISSCWNHRGCSAWPDFIRVNVTRIVVILAVGAVSFMVSMPDARLYPAKVKEGLDYEIKHNQMGHLGEFRAEDSTPIRRILRTGKMLNRAGGPYLFACASLALIFCLIRLNRPRIFLLYVMFVWLFVLYRNIVSAERHHLIPFSVMILLIALTLDAFWACPRRQLLVPARAVFIFLFVSELLYACIAASPFWQPESRLECARWVQQHFPPGTGVATTPHTPMWTVPGPMVGREELKNFRPQPSPGRDMLWLAAHRSLNLFKKHPPDRPINPKEWFYADSPPSIQTLRFYAELNKEQSPYFTRLKVFFAKPEFLGFDMSLFGQPDDTDTVYANRAITVFRENRRPAPGR